MNMPQFQGFDASNYQAPSYGALPKGWYKAVIESSEFKPTRSGGMAIQLVFSIIDGFAKGRKVFARYNVINDNDDTVRIAYEQLGALSHAVGVIRWQNPQELHNIPLNLRLKVTSQDGYEDSNDPNGYANINDPVKYAAKEASAPATGAPAVSSPFPGQAANNTVNTPFPGAAQQPAANPFPVQQQAPVQQPVQQQPVQQAPVQQQVAPQQDATAAQPWANAQQPWDNPANAAAPQQQAVQQQAPVQQAPVQEAAPQQAVQQPWAQQQAQPGQAAAPQQQAQPQQQVEAHPAQAAVPPWQQ